MPNVLRPRDIVSRPDNMGETVLHTDEKRGYFFIFTWVHVRTPTVYVLEKNKKK